jgi:DNA-directed RNA polymerase sigma subunit (sigma70/sigma32)
MSDTPPDDEVPEWWKQLSPDAQAFCRRIMGRKWRPGRTPDELWPVFDVTREQIRQIEEKALKKLSGRDNDDKN